MYANDRLGDCTCAAAGHMIEAWTAAAGQVVEISESAVIVAFEQVKIVDPATGEEGAVELDVLKFWRKTGIARHRIGAFASVLGARQEARPHRVVPLRRPLHRPLAAAHRAGPGRLGLDGLAHRPGEARAPGAVTPSTSSATRGRVSRSSPGARVKQMTWAFWQRYCDEAYCILSPDFLNGRQAPNGFDLAALKADLALVTA